MKWNYNPEQYSEKNFKPIDEGDYRVRISKAEYKAYASGKACYEVMLDVNGYSSKLWYHIWLDPFDERKTNQKLGEFFHSFGIGGGEYQSFDAWIGKTGAVRVKHVEYEGRMTARAVFCLSLSQQDKLPAWEEGFMATQNCTSQEVRNIFTAAMPTVSSAMPSREFKGFTF